MEGLVAPHLQRERIPVQVTPSTRAEGNSDQSLLPLPDSEGTPPAAQAAGTRPAVRARTSKTDRKRDNSFVCMEKTPSKLQNYGCAVGGFLPLHRL